MNSKQLNFRWINGKETDQREWLFKHLLRKKYLPDPFPSMERASLSDLQNELSRWPNDPEHRERVKDMSNAWAQEKQRRKAGQKSYGFVLSIKTKAALDGIAKRQRLSLKDCLTELIIQHEHAERKYRRLLADAEKRHKDEIYAQRLLTAAMGALVGDALNELAICTIGLNETRLTRDAFPPPNDQDTREAYENLKHAVIARSPYLKTFPQKKMAGLIKRPFTEQVEASLARTFTTETNAPAHVISTASSPTDIAIPLLASPSRDNASITTPEPATTEISPDGSATTTTANKLLKIQLQRKRTSQLAFSPLGSVKSTEPGSQRLNGREDSKTEGIGNATRPNEHRNNEKNREGDK